jgi:hypothetical protein
MKRWKPYSMGCAGHLAGEAIDGARMRHMHRVNQWGLLAPPLSTHRPSPADAVIAARATERRIAIRSIDWHSELQARVRNSSGLANARAFRLRPDSTAIRVGHT